MELLHLTVEHPLTICAFSNLNSFLIIILLSLRVFLSFCKVVYKAQTKGRIRPYKRACKTMSAKSLYSFIGIPDSYMQSITKVIPFCFTKLNKRLSIGFKFFFTARNRHAIDFRLRRMDAYTFYLIF